MKDPNSSEVKQEVTPEIQNTATEDRVTGSQILQAEQELHELISRKKQVDRNLTHLEVQIYHYETSYLEETHAYGNIIKGFDGYLGNRSIERRRGIQDSDRIFSNSSLTYPKALASHTESFVPIMKTNQLSGDETTSQDDLPRKRRKKKASKLKLEESSDAEFHDSNVFKEENADNND